MEMNNGCCSCAELKNLDLVSPSNTQLSYFQVTNGPPSDGKVTPDNAGNGGKDVKDTTTTNSVPDESSGKPDAGTPGGPKKPGTGEGGKGGATGDGARSDGGTDVAAGGGATGTNVDPVPPPIPPIKPRPPKPTPNAGGPGVPESKENVIYGILCYFVYS